MSNASTLTPFIISQVNLYPRKALGEAGGGINTFIKRSHQKQAKASATRVAERTWEKIDQVTPKKVVTGHK